MCTIREVQGRGLEVARQIIEANRIIWEMREALMYDLMDVN